MSDNQARDPIRRGLATLIDEAPVAPEFHELTATRLVPFHERRARRTLGVTLSTVAMTVVVVAGAVWVGGTGTEPTFEPLAVPNDSASTVTTLADLPPGEFPRVLLDLPEWPITYVDYSEGVNPMGAFAVSTIQFGARGDDDPHRELRLDAGSFADLDGLIADRIAGGARLDDQPTWDTTAVIVDRGRSSFTAMWESNSVEYEFLASDVDEETFRSMLESLRQVSEAEWRTVLSDDIITDRAAAVSAYLDEMPIPAGLDTAALSEGPIEHWYPVAAETISAVSCVWIEDWIDAKEAGDTEAMQRAVDAMSTSHEWSVLADMKKEGDYPLVVWEYADAMAGDGTIVAGDFTTVEASYQRAFGCS